MTRRRRLAGALLVAGLACLGPWPGAAADDVEAIIRDRGFSDDEWAALPQRFRNQTDRVLLMASLPDHLLYRLKMCRSDVFEHAGDVPALVEARWDQAGPYLQSRFPDVDPGKTARLIRSVRTEAAASRSQVDGPSCAEVAGPGFVHGDQVIGELRRHLSVPFDSIDHLADQKPGLP